MLLVDREVDAVTRTPLNHVNATRKEEPVEQIAALLDELGIIRVERDPQAERPWAFRDPAVAQIHGEKLGVVVHREADRLHRFPHRGQIEMGLVRS